MAKLKQKFCFAHMAAAFAYAKLSHCKRLQVGSIFVTRGGMTAQGYNGRPAGEPNVGETADGSTHPDVRHAEVNGLKKITRSNESSVGSICFSTHMPCRQCAIDMVDAGVSAVFYCEPYRDISGVEYLSKHGVKVYNLDQDLEVVYEVQFDFMGALQLRFRSTDRYPELEV